MVRKPGPTKGGLRGPLLAVVLGSILASAPTRAQEQSSVAERQIARDGQLLLQRKQYRALIELIKPLAPQRSSSPEGRRGAQLPIAGSRRLGAKLR
jgi:hypothetical protein